jgi:NAD-reducing hydrogenase small subunit
VAKAKVATVWLDACAGCHMSFLDIDEAIIQIAELVEFTRSPITDIKEFTPVDVGIVEGAVGNEDEEKVLKELRQNCKILMAWGDCACFGGIASMRNLFEKEEILHRSYVDSESTGKGKSPSSKDIPPLLDRVKRVDEVVKVDCYVPGCPPSPQAIKYALEELLAGRIPILPSEVMRFD